METLSNVRRQKSSQKIKHFNPCRRFRWQNRGPNFGRTKNKVWNQLFETTQQQLQHPTSIDDEN